ncbi:2-succinyl-5-enolpyruvyl-6-hydroxy-3-cyclohexene-1-carboxylic-acid synthase [candidate division KSB1 bacterium]|nr:2-succinyl-5-enolpyruvyl-6-hydroxy-3-cyclohexene-1-carboxylic-acid synthase [candidate division KSB1 bacterium]
MSLCKENINTLWASLLIEELVRNGVTYFCISPGSRSTPLTVAAARHPEVQCLICYDERGAAFHALGYARGAGKPAALICTSGTAAANYYPAVIEASMDFVPLILLTADRPPELRETGANQTIRQPRLYHDYCRWQFDMPCPDMKIPPNMVLTTADQLAYRAKNSPAGPVHLNCMFREPLAPVEENVPEFYLGPVKTWLLSRNPYTDYKKTFRNLNAESSVETARVLNNTRNGLLVIGRLRTDRERDAVCSLIDKLKWPVFADILSGLSMGKQNNYIIPHYDRLLKFEFFNIPAKPDVVLHIGGAPVSKRLMRLIEESSPEHYIVINDNPARLDPAHIVTTRIEAAPELFCRELLTKVKAKSDENRTTRLLSISKQAETVFKQSIDTNNDITEAGIARVISQLIPKDHGLFLANSMPVREMDMYACPEKNRIFVGCNRGVSGIDGTIASAAGFAAGLNRPVTLLAGDLAFIHDINSLLLLKSVTQPVVIVLVNNHGGGIFHFLPIAEHKDIFEKYFITPHNLYFESSAKQFDIPYQQPQNLTDFQNCYQAALNSQKSTIIEIQSNSKLNFEFHQFILTKLKRLKG